MTRNLKKSILVSALLLEMGSMAQAATIEVDGSCSFLDALESANTDSSVSDCEIGNGDDVINLPEGALIELTETAVIDSNVTLNGNGSVIQRDYNYGGFRIFEVNKFLTANDFSVRRGRDSNNLGAGMYVRPGGSAFLSDCEFNGNGGGAIHINSVGSFIENCFIHENWIDGVTDFSAGVSITSGTVSISNSNISLNNTYSNTTGGGGIFISNDNGSANLNLVNSTVFNNRSLSGAGGISIQKPSSSGLVVSVTQSTITKNRATSSNHVGGIWHNGGYLYISQSLIAGNIGSGTNEIFSSLGTVSVDNYNLFGLNMDSGILGFNIGGSDFTPVESDLADVVAQQLEDNGGQTLTLSLPPGSPAIDAVTDNCLLSIDQTGKQRPIDGDADGTADCDVGAFENENPDVIFKDGFE